MDPRLIKGKKFETFIAQKLHNTPFSDLQVPLFINTVSINTHQEVVFSSGPVAPAIRVSMSVPGVWLCKSTSTISIHTITLLFDTMVYMQGAITKLRLQTLSQPSVLLVPELQGHFF